MLQAWIVNDDHYSQVLVSNPNPLDANAPFTSAANLGYNGLCIRATAEALRCTAC